MRSTGGSPSGHQQPCQRNEIRSSPLMSGRSPRSVRTGSAMSHRNAPLSPEGRRRLIQRCQDRPIAACCRRDGHLTVVRVKVGQPIPRIRRTRPPRSILHPASSADSDPRRNQSPTSSICVVHRNGQPRALRSNSTTKAPTSADVPSPATRDSWDYTAADSSTERRQQPPAAQDHSPDAQDTRSTSTSRRSDASPTAADGTPTGAAAITPGTVARSKTKGERSGYVYLHSAGDGYSRLAYAEALPDEKAATAIGFVHRARVGSPLMASSEPSG